MSAAWIIALIIAGLLLGGIVFTFLIAQRVYKLHLIRPGKNAWNRGVCSFPEDEESNRMFDEGMAWHEEQKEFARPVSVTSEGLHLEGEYYDFGFDRAVLILAGRAEALTYSYYFAQPYRSFGYNILLIDNRAHGLSDGNYNCVALREYRDVQQWIALLTGTLGNKAVLLHGICIGAAAALYSVTEGEVPSGVEALVTDGMYVNFGESFRNHMIEINKPIFPVYRECMLLIALHAGKNPVRFGPQNHIDKLKTPILMLYGKQDAYSVPEKSKWLYERCSAPVKRIVWFDKGVHSHLRVNAVDKYDAAIGKFLDELHNTSAEERI